MIDSTQLTTGGDTCTATESGQQSVVNAALDFELKTK